MGLKNKKQNALGRAERTLNKYNGFDTDCSSCTLNSESLNYQDFGDCSYKQRFDDDFIPCQDYANRVKNWSKKLREASGKKDIRRLLNEEPELLTREEIFFEKLISSINYSNEREAVVND